jgi:hypothetical protein
MLFVETVAVYSENHTEHTNTLFGHNSKFYYVKAGITKLCRQQTEVMQNHENEHVRDMGQGEARQIRVLNLVAIKLHFNCHKLHNDYILSTIIWNKVIAYDLTRINKKQVGSIVITVDISSIYILALMVYLMDCNEIAQWSRYFAADSRRKCFILGCVSWFYDSNFIYL